MHTLHMAWRCWFFLLVTKILLIPLALGFQNFAIPPSNRQQQSNRQFERTTLLSSSPPKQQQEEETKVAYADEDAPAGIEGAQFFGGNKRKQEFYDPEAEAKAGLTANFEFVDRFQDPTAFPDAQATSVAQKLQELILRQLNTDTPPAEETLYATKTKWDSPFAENNKYATPLQALTEQASFYRNELSVAIVSACYTGSSENEIKLRWELSVVYPTLWEPSIVITGTSIVQWDGNQITAQRDVWDDPDTVNRQFLPRFWDLYHIGMSPAAQDRTLAPVKPLGYSIVTTPPRWIWQVSMIDEDRASANAAHFPDHAFTTIIKVVGPQKQKYQTVIGVGVDLEPNKDDGSVKITWNIPLSVEYASTGPWRVVPGEDARFVYQPARRFAVVPYGGDGPQDEAVVEVRKRLYQDAVVKGGEVPVVSTTTNRPQFSYGMNVIKACYTNSGGMGMAVYEWRPKWTRPDQVMLELDCKGDILVKV